MTERDWPFRDDDQEEYGPDDEESVEFEDDEEDEQLFRKAAFRQLSFFSLYYK